MKNLDERFGMMVAALVKPGQDIIESLSPERADLLHMAVGVSGEAGELLDAVKKHVIYNKPLDIENVKEEIGDLYFYIERILQLIDTSRDEIMERNIAKLTKRYGEKYSDKAAQERADKRE
jgi:NTP pyrophosphatase (non-canonical NTP hydrolase)